MIKTVYLKNTESLMDEILTINFDEHINVIIGPKGGGKSTLFDLVASITKGYIPTNVVNALKEYKLEFIKAELFSGETIFANQLNKRTDKEKIKDFEIRNDVIFQDDPIKKNLNKLSDIEDEKYNHAKEVIYNNESKINPFIKQIHNFYNQVKNICNMNDNNINWTNTFEIKDIKKELNIISQLNYLQKDFLNKIDDEINELNLVKNNAKDQITKLNNHLSRYKFNQIYEDKLFLEKFSEHNHKILKEFEQIILLIDSRKKQLEKIKKIVEIFARVYKRKLDEIKKNNYKEQGMKTFEKHSKDHFKKMAYSIYELKSTFKKLIDQDVYIDIEDEPKTTSFLSYKMKDKIKLNQDLIIDLIKSVLHTPKSTKEVSKWISENQKEGKVFKEFNDSKIQNKLAKAFQNDVMVYADGKQYETMSLGQKSIYGIKYKFKRNNEQYLFLDQPEDNLDNNTIATNILDLINQKTNSQIFIVTHNANIGILTKPEKIIVADLTNENFVNKYSQGKLIATKDNENNDCESAIYLEGGLTYLEQRYKIVKGEN